MFDIKKDAFGEVLEVGDDVIFCLLTGRSSSSLYKGTIIRFTPKQVTIEYYDKTWDGKHCKNITSMKNFKGIYKL